MSYEGVRVTITGVDNLTAIDRVRALSQHFPFVEWGVLYSEARRGTGRYPSHPLRWLEELPCAALHLCGRAARAVLGGAHHEDVMYMAAQTGSRVQLNGYTQATPEFLAAVGREAAFQSVEFILQCRSVEHLAAAVADVTAIEARGGRASLLFDPSAGRGQAAKRDVSAPCRFGLAGGIGPENVADVLVAAMRVGAGWIDMESKVRIRDRLDLDMVEVVLRRAGRARMWM